MSVAARCQGAIDYTKYISPIVENAVLDRIECQDILALYSTRDVLAEDGKSRIMLTLDGITSLKKMFRPWVYNNSNDNSSASNNTMSMADKMVLLRSMLNTNKG